MSLTNQLHLGSGTGLDGFLGKQNFTPKSLGGELSSIELYLEIKWETIELPFVWMSPKRGSGVCMHRKYCVNCDLYRTNCNIGLVFM